jgi:hypothetical protein
MIGEGRTRAESRRSAPVFAAAPRVPRVCGIEGFSTI